MKNLSPESVARLRRRCARVPDAPDGLALTPQGRLTPQAHLDVQRRVESIFRRHRTVGGAMTLVVRGRLAGVFPYGLARVESAQPVTEDTCFRVASVSKLVFTFALLRLWEDGLVDLDADIGAYLGYDVRNPRFPDAPLTLRQLLTHTSSLVDSPLYGGPGARGEIPLRDLLTPPQGDASFGQSAPGSVFAYSNLGAGVAGSIMERVTGERFDDLMQRLVFGPLSIRASFAPQRIVPAQDLASGYRVRPLLPPRLAYDAPALVRQPLPPMDPERDFTWAPGRLVVQPAGMAQLLRLLLSDGQVDGVRALRPETMALMRAPQDGLGSVQRAGRGLNVAFLDGLFGRRLVGHQGVAYGMNAECWGDPATGSGVTVQTSGTRLCICEGFVRCGLEMTAFAMRLIDRLP